MTERLPDLPRKLVELAQELGQRPRWHDGAEICRAAAQSLTDSEAQLAKEREAHRYTAQALVEACAARDAKDEVIATLRAERDAIRDVLKADTPATAALALDSIAAILEGEPDADREARRAGQLDLDGVGLRAVAYMAESMGMRQTEDDQEQDFILGHLHTFALQELEALAQKGEK